MAAKESWTTYGNRPSSRAHLRPEKLDEKSEIQRKK
jgi:hypothetical protein